MTKLGALETHDGRHRLVFTRSLAHAPDKVWRAITEPQHLQAWFPQEIVGERKVGAKLRFVDKTGEAEGEMLVFDPPRVLEFVWAGNETMRFEITPTDDGCELRVVNTFQTIGKAARDGAGWHACLDFLEYELDGSTPPWPSTYEHWADVKDDYIAAFPPEASTLGPPAV